MKWSAMAMAGTAEKNDENSAENMEDTIFTI